MLFYYTAELIANLINFKIIMVITNYTLFRFGFDLNFLGMAVIYFFLTEEGMGN